MLWISIGKRNKKKFNWEGIQKYINDSNKPPEDGNQSPENGNQSPENDKPSPENDNKPSEDGNKPPEPWLEPASHSDNTHNTNNNFNRSASNMSLLGNSVSKVKIINVILYSGIIIIAGAILIMSLKLLLIWGIQLHSIVIDPQQCWTWIYLKVSSLSNWHWNVIWSLSKEAYYIIFLCSTKLMT